MTKEERVYITFDELTEVEFECRHENCGATFALPIDKLVPPERCPNCNKEWFKRGDTKRGIITNLFENLCGIAKERFDFALRIRLANHD